MTNPAYPPLNFPKMLADDVWIVDSQPLAAMGLIVLPLRMTVFRLKNGDLLLFSPTHYVDTLREALEKLGPIRHLVAPSSAHWMFVADWQQQCPDAIVWGPVELARRSAVRRSGLHIARFLQDAAPPQDWADDLDQISFSAPAYREFAFYHRRSRTLAVTDIVVNVEADKLPAASRVMAELAGMCAPDGRAPAQLRALLRLRREANAEAAKRLLAFSADRLVVSHGAIVDADVPEHLRRSLDWLISANTDAAVARQRSEVMVGVAAVLASLAIGLRKLRQGSRRQERRNRTTRRRR